MWGLEYLLLFGLPKNKVEVLDGRTRCVFPFANRQEADAHFVAWTETLSRWRGAAPSAVAPHDGHSKAHVGEATLSLYPRPIELSLPLTVDPLVALHGSFWRRDFWPEQPAGRETGWEDAQRHSDICLNLWRLFEEIETRCGGTHSGRADLALTDRDAVGPDQYWFHSSSRECLKAGDYFAGVPDFVAEVLSPATRCLDRGPRRELYERVGIRHLWLLDPELETVEEYELAGGRYHRTGVHGMGESFCPVRFAETSVCVDALFDTQWKRHPDWHFHLPEEALGEWLVPPGQRLGLEYLLLLGHPERRHEIWNNRAPCVLAFGSEEEAGLRLRHFVEDACRWEGTAVSQPTVLEPGLERAAVGRFHLARTGRIVHLSVAVDARLYRSLLEVWSRTDAWDWGDAA